VTTIRLVKIPSICIAPQYVAEELLHAEGFTDVRYLTVPLPADIEALARGEVDFSPDRRDSANLGVLHLPYIYRNRRSWRQRCSSRSRKVDGGIILIS
jgi:hypothetical protein